MNYGALANKQPAAVERQRWRFDHIARRLISTQADSKDRYVAWRAPAAPAQSQPASGRLGVRERSTPATINLGMAQGRQHSRDGWRQPAWRAQRLKRSHLHGSPPDPHGQSRSAKKGEGQRQR